MADLAYAFKWQLSELRQIPLDELMFWHDEAKKFLSKGK